ncbi:MAG: signal peptidase II [Pseudomonadota bacterium]
MRVLWITAAVVFVVDQLTKWYIVHFLELDRKLFIEVVPSVLNLRMTWNYGVNFGLFSGDGAYTRWILIAVAFVVCAIVLWWMRKGQTTFAYVLAGLLIGGAAGNVIDRVIYGAVADFLNISCCGIRNPYAFNVADISIFIGAAGLALFSKDPNKVDA